MKSKPLPIFAKLGLIPMAVLCSTAAQAGIYYWDSNGNVGGFGNTSGIWGSSTFWSTNSAGTANGANTTILATDDINFGTAANPYTGTVTLNGAKSAYSMTFGGTGALTLLGDSASRAITLGNGGLTMASGAGAVTLGNGTATQNVTIALAYGAQSWTNNSSSDFTIANSAAASISRVAGATLTFVKGSTGNFSMSATHLPNDASGIVGPWSFFGTGASQRYAFNNAGIIDAYSGGTAAAGAEDFTSATTNYDFDGSGTNTLSASRTANTIRYTGSGHTIDLGASGANTLTANGILAVGASGTLAIQRSGGTGTLDIGGFNDLVIAGTQNVSISAPITGASGNLTYAGSGTLTLSGANTYGGATTVGSGTLVIDGTGVLPAATQVNIGNAAGTTFRINNNATIGNLTGDGSLGTVALQGNALTLGNANSTSFNGQFTGTSASGIIKQGTGTLTLGTATSIPGTMTINQGTVRIAATSFSGGTITLNANNAVIYASTGTVTGTAGLAQTTISNPIALGSSVTTTGASIYTAGAARWNFTGSITGGATSGSQTLKFDSRAGGTVGGDRTSTLFSGVISNGNGGGALDLSFNITPQSASNASNAHPTNVSLSGVNTFTGTITAFRSVTGATSWLTIGGERWTTGSFGANTPTYGREGAGYLAGPGNDGVFTSAINFGSTANNIVNLNYFSSANQTFAGVIGGGSNNQGALVKEGSGTLTLSNANGYASLTTIGGGTLRLGFGDNGNGVTNNILPSSTPLWMGLGTVYDPITANADMIISGGGGGGTLQLAGAAASATQTVASLNVSANTANRILMGADRTLTITSGTIAIGANSGLNFNTVAGGNNGATVGSSVIAFGGVPTAFTSGFTVTDAGGFGLAMVNGSNQVIRDASTTLLPDSGASSATNYRIDNNGGGSSAAGSSSLAVTSNQSAKSITVDSTAAGGALTLNSGVVLSNNVWNFGAASGTNAYEVTGSTGGAGLKAVASGDTISINNFSPGAVTFSSPILANGTNSLIVGGTGTVALTGVNTYTGATTINSGTLQIGGSGSLNSGTYAGAISINGGSILKYSSSVNQTLSGIIGGPGGITKDTDASSVLTLSGTNIYTGPTTVNAGILKAGAAAGGQAFGGGSAVTLANTVGVALDLNNTNQTIGSLAGGGVSGGNVTLGSGTLTTGGDNTSTTFAGVMAGSGGLIKNGVGTMTLTGANSYNGATTVNTGSLIINGSTSTTSIVSVASGATLGGRGTVGGNTTILGNISPGTSPGTLSFTNNLTLSSGATYLFEGGDLAAVGQALTLTDNWTLALGTGFQEGGQVLLFTYGSLAASPDLTPSFDTAGLGFTPSGPLSLTDNGSGSIFLNGISAIPEPSTALLAGLGLLALLRRRR